MPGANFQPSFGSEFADLDRRVRALEGSQRTGLGGVISARATAAASPTTFGAYELGSAGNTWIDDKARTGTGYPTVTITATSRMLIMWGARPINVAGGAAFRSKTVQVAVRYKLLSTGGITDGNLNRQFDNTNSGAVNVPISSAMIQTGFAPGYDYEFQLEASWENTAPAAPTQPTLTDSYLIVLPLSAA